MGLTQCQGTGLEHKQFVRKPDVFKKEKRKMEKTDLEFSPRSITFLVARQNSLASFQQKMLKLSLQVF